MAETTIIISGQSFKALKKSIVYMWRRGDTVLFIGFGPHGFYRAFSATGHDIVNNLEPVLADDVIEVIPYSTKDLARQAQIALIEIWKPRYNKSEFLENQIDQMELTIEKRLRKEFRALRGFTSPELSILVKRKQESKTIPDFRDDETKLLVKHFLEEMKLKYELAGDLVNLKRVKAQQQLEEGEVSEFDKMLEDL